MKRGVLVPELRGSAAGYLLGAFLPALAIVLHVLFAEGLSSDSVYLLSTLAVGAVSLAFGIGPGLLACGMSLAAIALFRLEPIGQFAIQHPRDLVAWSGYGVLWIGLSVVGESFRRVKVKRKEDQSRAEESGRRLDSILSSITDSFFAVDLDWRITHVNAAFERVSAKPRSALVGTILWDLWVAPSHYETRVKMTEAQRAGTPFIQDLRDPKSGIWHHIRAYPSPMGMFVSMQDITEEKSLEQSRERMLAAERKARNDAEIANRIKDEFLATLSHELRSPLTTILGWTEILARHPTTDEKLSEGLSMIDRSAHHQLRLIGDLLDISRIAAGKFKLDMGVVNLADAAYEAVELTRPDAERKGIDLAVDVQNDTILVRGDFQRLVQVLTNLLSNAVKFTSSGGQARIEVKGDDSFGIVAVEDDGEGIDPDFLPFLFDRFRQSDGSASRRHGGLGLGLAIVKQLVELHGGQVSAASEGKGKGSRFEIRVPATAIPAVLAPAVEVPTDSRSLEGLRILVVDDEAGTRTMLRQMLSDAGAEVMLAESGFAALEELSAQSFDLVLSDIGMPEMDGYQFLKLARRRFGRHGGLPPAIALTAFVGDDIRAKSKKAGFVGHLVKPIDYRALVQGISAATEAEEKAATSAGA